MVNKSQNKRFVFRDIELLSYAKLWSITESLIFAKVLICSSLVINM